MFILNIYCYFFFSSRRRHTRWTGDWSSDVCSSDLRRVGTTTLTEPLMFARISPVILALAAVACSDSAGPSSQPSLAQLTGAWDLSRLEMLLASDTSVSRDVRAESGLTATLTIAVNGAATLVAAVPGQPEITVSATISLRGDTIVYEVEGYTYEAIVRLASRTMTWRSVETGYYDLDDNGSAEAVFERDVWQRR